MDALFSTYDEAERLHQTYALPFDVEEIETIWRDYSRSLGAGWIMQDGMTQQEIDNVFKNYVRLPDGNIWKKI